VGGSVAVKHAAAADAVDPLGAHCVQHLLLLRLRARLLLLELPLHLLLLQVEVESTELVCRGLREGGGSGEKGGEDDEGFHGVVFLLVQWRTVGPRLIHRSTGGLFYSAILLLLPANPRSPIGLRAARCSQPDRLVQLGAKNQKIGRK
jgi:hypothetical protein